MCLLPEYTVEIFLVTSNKLRKILLKRFFSGLRKLLETIKTFLTFIKLLTWRQITLIMMK
jgi:hypothetical protein